MSDAYDSFNFEHAGRHFVASLYVDYSNDAPWENDCGSGVVSDWEHRDKLPGERVLAEDGRSKRFYDVSATMAVARRDRWGICDEEKANLAAKLGRTPTDGEIRAAAVEKDFEFLRGWCNDDWHYCGVGVRLLDEAGEPVGDEFEHALWGIESNAGDYLEEVACELAEQVPTRAQLLAVDMKALAKRMHDAIDADGENEPGMREMADSLQQMATNIAGE